MYRILVISPESECWSAARDLVIRAYGKKYEAAIDITYRRLIICEPLHESGCVLSCAGFQLASDHPLFSERYLPQCAESVISEKMQRPVSRDQIFEVGSLASSTMGAGRELVRSTPFAGWCMGQRYMLVTITSRLRAMLDDLGMVYELLTSADIAAIPEARRRDWGRYYETQPVCVVIPLDRNVHLFGGDEHQYAFAPEQLNLAITRRSA